MRSIVAQCIALGGAFLMLIAAIGAVRFATVFHRMHALSVAGATGLGLIAVGAAVGARNASAIAPLILVMVFQFLTVPVASHLIARAAHRSVDRVTSTGIDDLQGADGHSPVDS